MAVGSASEADRGGGPRVVVIGAGIIGVCAALQLQRAGAHTVILDRQAPGEGASFGNASILGDATVVPVATPGVLRGLPRMLLDSTGPLALRWSYLPKLWPWLVRFLAAARPREVERISKALADLLDGSLAAYDPLLQEAGAPDVIRKTGWLTLYETERGFRRDAASRALKARRGRHPEVVPTEALRQFEPALADSGRFHKGVFEPEMAHALDNLRVVQVLARNLRQRGGRIYRESVQGFDIDSDGLNGVVTDKGRHACDAVVIAAGAWSRPLAREVHGDLPLDTERGYHLTLPNPGVTPRLPIDSAERAMVCTPLSEGLRLAGTVELGGLDAPPNWRRAEMLFDHARHLFPDLDATGAKRWMGFRPSMPDSLPVISRAARFPNAVLAFGHGHCGLMLGARTGELVRDLVLDRTPGLDLTPFRADRFGRRPTTLEDR